MRWMLAIGALLMGSSAGCGRGSDSASPSPVTPVTPATTEDAGQPALAAPSPYDDQGRVRVAGERELFVGRLRINRPEDMTAPSEYCLEDGQLWAGSEYRLGRVNVFGLAPGAVETGGDAVAIFAVRRPSLDAVVVARGPCPADYGREAEQMQMRSDWVADEGGFRTSHAKLATVPYLEASGFVLVRLHEIVDQSDTKTRLRLHNPFDVALDGVTFQLHYEGGPGKPMPTFVDIDPAPVLPPGGSAEIAVARTPSGEPVDPNRQRRDRLFGLVVRGQVGQLHLDVELPVD